MKKDFDENMIINKEIDRPGICYHSIDEEAFDIRGVFFEEGALVRMPREVAERVSPGIARRYVNNAGGRVRFVTDSPYVAVSAIINALDIFSTITLVATTGMDVYADGDFCGAIIPDSSATDLCVSGTVYMHTAGEHLIEINLPLYSSVESLTIGIDESAVLKHAPEYSHSNPVVFYGSSITNGAAASRPGMAYVSQLARKLDFDYVNLGFGGLCKAEEAMVNYIASLDMSVFVLDYDYNAPDAEYLERTHENVYLTVRKNHPSVPIIMISAPVAVQTPRWKKRYEIIKRTYDNAVKSGDKNVYLINGGEFFDKIGYDYTVDGIHPNDLGFALMAEKISKTLEKVLK